MCVILKRVLPFAIALIVGFALGSLSGLIRQRDARQHEEAVAKTSTATDPRLVPEVYVLSPIMIDECIKFEKTGGYEGFKVLSPESARNMPAKIRNEKQGVVQFNVQFGADGTISEITPRAKRVDCGDCLPRDKRVIEIDPNAPQSRERIEAAVEAIKRIRFIPFQSAGQYISSHGLVECVFYQWD